MNFAHACVGPNYLNYHFKDGQVFFREEIVPTPTLIGSAGTEYNIRQTYSITEYLLQDSITVISWLVFSFLLVYGLLFMYRNWGLAGIKGVLGIPIGLFVFALLTLSIGPLIIGTCSTFSYTSENLIVTLVMYVVSRLLPIIYLVTLLIYSVQFTRRRRQKQSQGVNQNS